jgi:BolA protein
MQIQNQITEKLNKALMPLHLEVINESGNHNVPAGSESHFKVTMVAETFDGESLVKRHQKVYQVLADELKGSVHALALHLYTLDEWRAKNGEAPLSPPCMGGEKG